MDMKKLHLLPPLALKLSKIRLNNASNNGPDTNMNGHLRSPSSLSANKTCEVNEVIGGSSYQAVI